MALVAKQHTVTGKDYYIKHEVFIELKSGALRRNLIISLQL